MILVQPKIISQLDKYASISLGIDTLELMRRAGEAVAGAIASSVEKGKKVIIFAGKGNNGGDGYAAACFIASDYNVTVYDVFASGQKTDEGKHFLEKFISSAGVVKALSFDSESVGEILSADCVVDAVFGTGFSGEYPGVVVELAKLLRLNTRAVMIAVDTPLGVNSSDGSVDERAVIRCDATVALGFVKPGLVSYPAKEYVGKLIYDNIGLHFDDFSREFTFNDYYIDVDLVSSLLPHRPDNSNKGTFGRLLMICGCERYVGAAYLSLESALRSGVGLVRYVGENKLCDLLTEKFPEAIYYPMSVTDPTDDDVDSLIKLSDTHAALLGSGSSVSKGLLKIIEGILSVDGPPVILDADAINVLSNNAQRAKDLISCSPRKVVLTPHPLEFSRISGISTEDIQANRLAFAKRFAAEYNCVLVLKGAATVVTDGIKTYINSSGSSALAKAGSGDVLAGTIASLVASGSDPLNAAAAAVYFHGLAADVLAKELSEFGVTPSDLPREIGRQIAVAQQIKA